MHLRIRTSPQFPSGFVVLKIETKNNLSKEVFNRYGQNFWENATPSHRTIHLKFLAHRTIEPILVVEFIEVGYLCVLQESNGIAQWCVELPPDGTYSENLTNALREHQFLSDKLVGMDGNTFNRILMLTQIPQLPVPQWMRDANPTNVHAIDIYLDNIDGIFGFISFMVRADAKLSDLFVAICGLESPRQFCLKYIGGPNIIPPQFQVRYTYNKVHRFGLSLRNANWPLSGVAWLKAEPMETDTNAAERR